MDDRRRSSAQGPNPEFVRVAVLPPRLPPGMGTPDPALGFGDVVSWDAALNYAHNEPDDGGKPRKKSIAQKIGLTMQREKRWKDQPNFKTREVPYEVWRAHYAKDAEGNYKGTGVPAEDCLLLPADLAKWNREVANGEAVKTKGDRVTRGKDVLPTYREEPGLEPEPEKRGSEFTADGKNTEEIIADYQKKHKKTSWKQSLKSGIEKGLLTA